MYCVWHTLICALCNIVIGAIGSLVAARVDRYLQRREWTEKLKLAYSAEDIFCSVRREEGEYP